MATLFNIDPAQVRKDAISVQKEGKKAGKSAKPAVSTEKNAENPIAAPSADAPDATKAAQAAEPMRDDARPTLKVKSEELIENKEKPTPADAPLPFASTADLHVGDRVLIKTGLKTMNGRGRKCCGHEGVIERLAGAYIHVRTAPGVSGLITNLVWNEVDKLPATIQAAPAAVAKTSRRPARTTLAKRQPAKSKKVLNEKAVHA